MIPASFFGFVLALAGLANWRAAHAAWSFPAVVAEAIFAAAVLASVVIVGLYALKWAVAPDVAREELGHAVQCYFVGLAGVATLLIAQGARAYSQPAATVLFLLGAAFTFGATALAILAPFLFGGANLLVLAIAAGTVRLLAMGRLLPPASAPRQPG